MATKSDMARVSATEAGRAFSSLLDKVEKGRRFVVHRHGRDVCVMAPPLPARRRASECLERLRTLAAVTLDDGFGDDLMDAIAGEPLEERPTWGS